MRRWRPALTAVVALAALLVPVHPAAADPGGPATAPPRAAAGPLAQLGHSNIKASERQRAQADHTITLRGIDLDGTPLPPKATLIDLATGAEFPMAETGATLTGRVPSGDYSLTGLVITGDPFNPRDLALYGNPTLTVDGDVDLTLDARTALEIKAVSPSETVTRSTANARLIDTIAGQKIISTIGGTPSTGLRAWPSPSGTTRPYHFLFAESQDEPLDTRPSPSVYNMAFPTTGRIPAKLTFTASPKSLALVNTTYASQGTAEGGIGPHSVVAFFDGIGELGVVHPAAAPSTQRVYYTANGVKWTGTYFYQAGAVQVAEVQTGPKSYTAGRTQSETWNRAAFGPTMYVGHGQGTLLARPLIADTGQPGHKSFAGNNSTGTTGTLTLYRNGRKVGVSDNPLAGGWTVPALPGLFRLDMAVQRKVPWSNYATGINARWTFLSAERPGDPLDQMHNVLQPRVTGDYDSLGRAPAGTTFPLDVTVEHSVQGPTLTWVSLDASFDDGATWKTVRVSRKGTDHWTARVVHPKTHNGYVALRVKAADSSGSTVEQTVTRAYGLR